MRPRRALIAYMSPGPFASSPPGRRINQCSAEADGNSSIVNTHSPTVRAFLTSRPSSATSFNNIIVNISALPTITTRLLNMASSLDFGQDLVPLTGSRVPLTSLPTSRTL